MARAHQAHSSSFPPFTVGCHIPNVLAVRQGHGTSPGARHASGRNIIDVTRTSAVNVTVNLEYKEYSPVRGLCNNCQ